MEKITNEIAEQVVKWFQGDDVKNVIEATEKALEAETGTFEVVITTENLDRYDEVIKLDGWDLEHYRKNPVVLWGHDHFTLPIGVATSVEIIDGKMVAKGKFSPHQHAQDIRALYDMGIVRATSVGFIEKEREGNLITKAELLEFSFVSVPANPYALSLAMEKELNINELVTKGIFRLKEVAESKEEEEKVEEEKPAEEAEPELTDEQKALAGFIIKEVVAAIKDGALDAAPEGEPEGTDDEEGDDEDDSDDEDVKAFEIKKALQRTDTILGDVLAELRQRDTHRS